MHDAILTAVVDGKMMEDKLILAVSKFLGVAWAAVKRAVERRVKMEDEDVERTEVSPTGGFWQRVKRSTRCDKYELPGFIQFQHNELFFRFSSRRSTPLRKWVAVGKYEVSVCALYPNLSCGLDSRPIFQYPVSPPPSHLLISLPITPRITLRISSLLVRSTGRARCRTR